MAEYKIPSQARIGHVHLKVADLERSLKFYRDLLGFEVQQYYGEYWNLRRMHKACRHIPGNSRQHGILSQIVQTRK